MNNPVNGGFSPEKLNELLGVASKKLGTDPEKLRRQLEQGDITEVVKGMAGDDAAKVSKLIANPKEIEKLMNNPQIKDMLGKLMNGK